MEQLANKLVVSFKQGVISGRLHSSSRHVTITDDLNLKEKMAQLISMIDTALTDALQLIRK